MSVNCHKCKHFYITHNPQTPRGCKIYQIQCQGVPSQIVKRANNGNDCIGFKPKETEKSKKKDLGDARYW